MTLTHGRVRNLTLIPNFAFSLSAVKKRPPLRATAQRHGWVSCNIILSNIPLDARVHLVYEGMIANPKDVHHIDTIAYVPLKDCRLSNAAGPPTS